MRYSLRLEPSTPLLLPAISLCLGIAAGRSWAVPMPALLAALLSVMAVALAASHRPRTQSVAILAGFLTLGAVLISLQQQDLASIDGRRIEAVVTSEPAEKPKTVALDLLATNAGNRQLHCYVWKDERSLSLKLGDALVLHHYRGPFVGRNDWHEGGNARQGLSRWQRSRLWFLGLRHQLLERFRSMQAEDEVYGVLAAMALGDKSAISPRLREHYSISGASHVLALSGLHLGIIYMLLSGLMLGRQRYWLVQLAMVCCIWAFTFITGLAPSITRSATMFSIYAIFTCRSRGKASLGVLCFTAMAMLAADAKSLFDIGFQMSFAAVFAILLFVPLLGRLWQPRHWLCRWCWRMVLVSVAAQLGVAPLIAFYFGRFSTYFLLTNFVVIPAATAILYTTLVALLVPAASGPLVWMVRQLNAVLATIARLPMASIEGLHPSVLQVGLLYLLFAILYLVIAIAKPRSLRISERRVA